MKSTSGSAKNAITISLQNFSDSSVKNSVASLFKQSEQWQQPWKVMKDPKQADFLMICCDNPTDLIHWHTFHHGTSRHNLISFSTKSFPEEARWHLQQPPNEGRLPLIKFVMLLKEINEFWKSFNNISTVSKIAKESPKIFDHNWREKAKILFVGSVGAGKTTAISTITNDKFINTEVRPTDNVKKIKQTTTVALDYGSTILEEGVKLDIYGAPGQRRFNFMSDILINKCMGIVILITNDAPDPLEELTYYLDYHASFLLKNKGVIGITHSDIVSNPSIADYEDFLSQRGEKWPIINVDVREHDGVMLLIKTLIDSVLEQK